METDKKKIVELVQAWQKLYFQIRKNNKIDVEFFKNTFSQTYSLLSQYAENDNVSKDLVELIAVAYLFANTESKTFDSKYLAILVLTERMLNSCAFTSTSVTTGASTVYVLKVRREVTINFNNVSEAVCILEKTFEEDYWNNL